MTIFPVIPLIIFMLALRLRGKSITPYSMTNKEYGLLESISSPRIISQEEIEELRETCYRGYFNSPGFHEHKDGKLSQTISMTNEGYQALFHEKARRSPYVSHLYYIYRAWECASVGERMLQAIIFGGLLGLWMAILSNS